MGFIDIHTHIIPGVDDGSKDNKESVEMLRKAYAAGITTIIATPHFSKGFHDYHPDDIRRYCKAIEKFAKDHIFAGFTVLPGQEIFYNDRSLTMLRSGEVIPLGDTKYVLLEFDPDISYNALYQAVREVTMTAYFPVLAHIEIYDCLREKGCIDELKELGVLMQMNYYHLGGKFFDDMTKWCKWLLKYGYVDILSTDMHNSTDKGPRMEKALSWMEKFLDDDYIEELTYGNAQRIMGIPSEKAEEKHENKTVPSGKEETKEEKPKQEKPKQEKPKEEKPKEEKPKEEKPKQETNKQETPKEEAVKSAPKTDTKPSEQSEPKEKEKETTNIPNKKGNKS